MQTEKILADPNYIDLVHRRRIVTVCLAAVLILVAIGFSVLSVWFPSTSSASVSNTVFFPLGLVVVESILLLALIIVCGYARHMSQTLGPLIEKIVRENTP